MGSGRMGTSQMTSGVSTLACSFRATGLENRDKSVFIFIFMLSLCFRRLKEIYFTRRKSHPFVMCNLGFLSFTELHDNHCCQVLDIFCFPFWDRVLLHSTVGSNLQSSCLSQGFQVCTTIRGQLQNVLNHLKRNIVPLSNASILKFPNLDDP